MSIEPRVRRLERQTNAGACPVCHGAGPMPVVLEWVKGQPKPVAPSCPHCGLCPGPMKLIILDGADGH